VGVSGAFLLLPFQVSVLGFAGPGVTPTNLLFNVLSTPGAIARYVYQDSLDWQLVRTILTGAVPGIILGSLLRVTVFAQPATFKGFVGLTLIVLGAHLWIQAPREKSVPVGAHRAYISLLGGLAGTLGGIYGISGGSIIAPALVGIFGVSVGRVAPAALIATLITSVTGVVSFLILDATSSSGARPDWLLALLFGIGGAVGGHIGAKLNLRVPHRPLRALRGALAIGLGLSYVAVVL
jgi:uncharacterized membrane protein YfcA